MKLEKSLRYIKRVLASIDSEYADEGLKDPDFLPDLSNYYFRVGNGLMIYEPQGYAAEMHASLTKGDTGKGFIKEIHKQWEYLRKEGFTTIYTRHDSKHLKASMMCRAAGMEKVKCEDKETNLYKMVINDGIT
jgi:hypothetical protein